MRNKTLIRLGAALALLSMLAGCGGGAEPTPSPSAPAAEVTPEIQAELDAQLGLLTGYITEEERQAALELWLQIRPLREARLAAGQWAWRPRETTLLTELSALYDGYTIQYLGGDEAGFGYAHPEQTPLFSYSIGADGALIADPSKAGQLTGWTEEELMVLWRDMTDLLPEGAFADFGRLTFFTDGPEETVAWVQAMDEPGDTWEIAVDPADAGDRRYFVETILHEYCHYLTLNNHQVSYGVPKRYDCYGENDMTSNPDSYLNAFYQRFWKDYLDDRLADPESDSFYLRLTNDGAPTLLTRAQDTLLSADEADLFERTLPEKSDRSVRFVEAPTPVREAESLVGVLTALPPERRLPFRMVGKPLSMENSAASALLQLLDLLSGLTTLSAFESWLELPVVGESLGLSFGDLSVLREWVNDAGFREGLSEAQLAAQSEKLGASFGGAYGEAERRGAVDGTLSRALERLSAGFLFDESPAVDWAGTLPVRRSRAHYERVSDRPDLLETLLTLYKRLEDARVAWNAVNDAAPGARDWAAFTETVVNDFFAGADVKAARDELLGVIAHLSIDMEEGIGSETTVDYQTFRAALGVSFGDPVSGAMPRDAVTVADMSAFRGLPYRVVACLGLSENSSFPGLSNFEEFDLMALTAPGQKGEIRSLRRPGDRDSRADNRNVFADLFRSAHSNFYVSWSIGTDPAQPALPSVVVEELERFLLTLLPEGTPSDALRVRLPLTSVAEENFRPEGLRFWTNRDPELFAAVEAARLTDRRGDPAPFADDAVLAPPEDGTVRWQEFLRFWTSPGKWLSGRTGVREKDFETSEETGVTPAKSRLEEVMRKRLLRGLFEEGADVERATRLLAENPVNGDPGVRGWWFAEEIAEADELTRRWKEITEGRTPSKLSLAVNVAGRHVRRLTGEVRVYPEADGTSAQLVLADSNRAEKEALLTHVFLSAAGAETALGVLKKEDKGVVFVRYRPMEADEAEEILRQCVRLLDESFDRPVIWPDSFEGGVFWRGLDIQKARDLRKRVEEAIAALLAPLAEVTATSSDEASESSDEAKASDQPKKGKSTKKKTSKKKEPECTPEEEREKALISLAENVEALVARNY